MTKRIFHNSLIILLNIFLITPNVFAIPDEKTLDYYDTIGAYYYDGTGGEIAEDPDFSEKSCTPAPSNSSPSGENITWIGDSYTATAEDDFHLISANLPGTDLGNGAYYQISKHIAMDGGAGNLGGTSGLNILKDIKSQNKLKPYLVFALGTNDPDYGNNPSALESQLNILIDSTHAGTDTTVVLVSPQTNEGTSMTSTFNKMTESMRNFANSHNNVVLADWNAAVKGKESQYFSSDNVHPNEQGIKVWVDTIKNALPKNLSGNNNLTSTSLPAETVQYLDSENVRGQVQANMERYKYAEQQTGLPWQILAALHYREAGLGSNLSISNGEPLYDHVNVDGIHVSADPNQDAVDAANHFIELAKSVYSVDVLKNPTTENYALGFLAYNRGFMYKDAGATWDQSPYVMNGYDANHMNMRFIHADSWYGGQKLNNVEGKVNSAPGALAVLAYLGATTYAGDACLEEDTTSSDEKSRTITKTGSNSGSDTISPNGLTEEQAAKLLAWYSVNKNDDSRQAITPEYWDRDRCRPNQCTAFSAFFVTKFTSQTLTGGTFNGGAAVDRAIAESGGGERLSEPVVFSLFQAPGHTGIVVGKKDDGTIIYANNNGHNCKSLPEPMNVITDFSPNEYYAWNYNSWGGMPHVGVVSHNTGVGGTATYLKLDVDEAKLMNYINNGP